MTKTLPIYALSAAIILGAIIFAYSQTQSATGAGWLGFPSHIQSATTTAVGPDEVVTLFADEPNATCHSRVITTAGSDIMISFDDVTGFGSTSLSSVVGHLQGASTTVSYDSGDYGCGLMTAYGVSSSTITISSF